MTSPEHPNPFLLLERNAARNPRGVFARTPAAVTTNREALDSVRRLAFELRRLGVRPGQLVALQVPDLLNTLFTEALFHESAVGCVLPRGYPAAGAVHVDWAFTVDDEPVPAAERVVRVDGAFLQHVEENPSGIRMREEPVQTLRVLFTSGSSGTPRAIAYGRERLDAVTDDDLVAMFAQGEALMLMDFSTIAGLTEFLLSVRADRPFLAGSGFSAADHIRFVEREGVRMLKGSPAHLADLVAELDRQQRTLPGLGVVLTAGSMLPSSMAERIVEVTEGCTIVNLYGATEAGGAAVRIGPGDPTDAGTVLPGVELEVVDDDDRPVADGVEGWVRWRAPGAAVEYVGDPVASAEVFRDGWFQPGDRALRRPDGGLTLAGRTTDVLNAGGVKIDASHLDDAARAHPFVTDAAAFPYRTAAGADSIGLAYSADDGFDRDALAEALTTEFRAAAPTLLVRVPEVPRTRTRKPARHVLTERFGS